MWVTIFAISFVVFEAFALYFSWQAIKHARTPQGSVGWVVFLITAPYVSVPVYLFLGHHKYTGYLTARRDSVDLRKNIDDWGEKNFPKSSNFKSEFKVFEKIADLPTVGGNNAHFLIDGDQTFSELFKAIEQAQHYILVQYYIVKDDALGQQFKLLLIDAVTRGVSVRMLIDGVGCIKLPDRFIKELIKAGVNIIDPKTVIGPKHRFQLNLRNHRKTVVVDGHTGFTGGLNIGVEYKGQDPKIGHWRDTHAKFNGLIVSQLQLIFAEDWRWVTGEDLVSHLNWEAPRQKEDIAALLVATGPGDDLETGSMMFFSAIASAKKRIWIASPYFVPDTVIVAALQEAAMRGVEVKILVPETADHQMPWLAAFAYFDEVMAAGCEVWKYTEGFMHQKVFLVDDTIAAVGTTNMDNRSFRLNFETMVLLFDPKCAGELEAILKSDFKRAYQLTKTLDQQPRRIQYGAPIARLFSPLL